MFSLFRVILARVSSQGARALLSVLFCALNLNILLARTQAAIAKSSLHKNRKDLVVCDGNMSNRNNLASLHARRLSCEHD